MPCFKKAKITDQESAKRLKAAKNKWFDHPVIDAITGGKIGPFERFYAEITGLDFDIGRLPNAKEMSRLERKMGVYLDQVTKTPTKLGALFKLPENILKKNPVTAKYFDSLVRISNYYRGNQQNIKGDLQIVLKALNKASGEANLMSKFGSSRSKAQKKIVDLENQYKKLQADQKWDEAQRFYDENLKDISESHNLEALKGLNELFLNPKLVDKQNLKIYNDSKLKYGGDLIAAANLWHYGIKGTKGQKSIRPLKERLWEILGQGLNKSIRVFEQFQTEHNDMQFKVNHLKKLYNTYFNPKKVNGKITNDMYLKRMKDYFPTQVLDIASTVSKFSQDIHSGFLDKGNVEGKQVIETYVRRMVEDVTSSLKISGHAFEGGPTAKLRTSQDIIGMLDSYANNVIRFNYNAAATESLVGALKDLNKLSGSKYNEHVRFLSDYIYDMHQSAVGSKYTNSKLASISRSITSYQFMSKLGLNIRSAARNATQSLQNWVYFGTKGITTAFSDLQSDYMKTIVGEQLGKHGFEFVNIQEISMPRELLGNVSIDKTGKVVQDIPSMGRKFGDYLEAVAKFSGKPMQWVENHVNRGLTFKIAFINRYNDLLSNDTSIRNILKKKMKSGEPTEQAVEDLVIKKASRYAADMVKELHYQYDPFAKIKATRNPVGSVLGQFSTYAINFFEYQRKILAKGGRDALAGEWGSPEAWRMYRLGMLYNVVTGISALFNTNFNNLVQNDTMERLTRLNQWLGGTKEEKQKAFFGLDPVTATFGGPFVSDVIRLGQILNLNKMSSTDYDSYLRGYADFHSKTDKGSKTEEIVRFLNTQIGRSVYTTLPRAVNGTGLPTLLGQELGLYNTPELTKLKEKILSPVQKVPGPIGKYFTPDNKKKKYYEGTKYTPEQIARILEVFG